MVPNRLLDASDERRDGRDRRGNCELDQQDDDLATPLLTRSESIVPTITNQPAASALSANQPATTKAGKPRQRMQWNNEMNENLMRCYYNVTQGESNITGFRIGLHREFTALYPQLNHLTEQRLADQRRMIIKTNKLPQSLLNELKQQALPTENMEPSPEIIQTEQIIPSPTPSNIEQERIESTENNNNINDDTLNTFRIAFETFNNTDPTRRPKLPKLKQGFQSQKIIQEVNQIIEQFIQENSSINDIHALIYTGAHTTITMNQQTIKCEQNSAT